MRSALLEFPAALPLGFFSSHGLWGSAPRRSIFRRRMVRSHRGAANDSNRANGPRTKRQDMPNKVDFIRIKGFRSLVDVEIDRLPMSTVLIGPNSAGKSNFIRFFEMTSWMLGPRRLGEFVRRHGGADDQLFGGSRQTPLMEGEFGMRTQQGRGDYRFVLAHAANDEFMFTKEAVRFSREEHETTAGWQEIKKSGHTEAMITEVTEDNPLGVNPMTANVLRDRLQRCSTYQFHDTSHDSRIKKSWDLEDNQYLRSDGANLASVLLFLEREDESRFNEICDCISLAVPVFDRFDIREQHGNGKVLLRWKIKGMDKTVGAHLTSDGSLRLFALVTLLNLPSPMLPEVLLLDEPELGLHPVAVGMVGEMIKALSHEKQIITATQSPLLVDEFGLDEIFVLELRDRQTNVKKCNGDEYQDWLQSYTPGELWQKNVIGGRP